ncbi:MAG: sugar transferase [Elusimicrobiaceae bacterium]|nr:sugar transferase [Elusimicrobiaceae bacterium]
MRTLAEKTAPASRSPGKLFAWSAVFFEKLWLPLAGMALDIILISAAFYYAYSLRFHFGPLVALLPPPAMQPFSVISSNFYAIIPVWLMVFYYSAKLYSDFAVKPEDVFVRALHGCLLSVIFSFALTFMLKSFAQSRLVYAMTLPIATLLVFAGNMTVRLIRKFALKHFGSSRTVLIVGGGKSAETALAVLKRMEFPDCLTAGHLTRTELLDLTRERGVNSVILANASFDKNDLLAIADQFELLGVELFIVPSMVETRLGEVQLNHAFGMPVIQIYHTSFFGTTYYTKRFTDLLFCALVAICGFIPFVLVALLIRLGSRGPVFYKQKRVGRNGRIFNIYKFRTMVADADLKLDQLSHLNERAGQVFKIKNDPRVTRVGKWLRRLSIDEFPQFINVLRGEMSIIGPRPPTVGEYEQYSETAKQRLRVLPGITGLWQVSGRADLDFDEMLVLDFYYIEHWSLGMDLMIMLRTPFAMISSRGAY